MSFLDRVDVLVLTWNEEANIARTLGALARFPRVVVLDSGSTDATLSIAAKYPNVRVCTRAFDNHSAQWNHGLTQCDLAAEWVLALDADYVLPAALIDEIAQLHPPVEIGRYVARFRYCVSGRPLRGSLYPPCSILFRRDGASYRQDGHTQRLVERGNAGALREPALHDDRKAWSAWLAAQDRYARLECALLRATPWAELRWRDRLRRMAVVTPWLVPLYCLVIKQGLLDGWCGVLYAIQRGVAESILSMRLIEARIGTGANDAC